jgi:aspartate aminotransferase-like enzyme
MSSEPNLQFRIATEEWEFEAIHALNYKTFVEEIPQHQQSGERRLVDKFHRENTYVICLDGKRLVGMLAMRANRPFSLDAKLPNLDSHLPAGRSIVEIRLLSVEKEYRNGYVFRGLLGLVLEFGKSKGYNFAIISGTTRQEKLYRHLGFIPFGPLVGTGDATFQPMYLTLETIEEKATSIFSPPKPGAQETLPVSFLPGPVDIAKPVREAFDAKPVSHRARAFMSEFKATRRLLCQLTNAASVEVLVGSGSLANDVVAGQISLLKEPGLVLSNGEFGERLVDHARRFGLDCQVMRLDWGGVFDLRDIRNAAKAGKIKWIWAVHCETSTGVLNDLHGLQQISAEFGIKLCLDCISSIGTVPVDLGGVYFASCVSGKGLGAFPGLSMVFYNHALDPAANNLPRYLDLGFYAAQEGIPFTHSSNLICALQTAVKRIDIEERFRDIVELSALLRARLSAMGFSIVASHEHGSPAVLTLALPAELSSKTIGWQLQKAGYLLSYRSEYLLKRNWIQICLMGEFSRPHLDSLLAILATYRPRRVPVTAPVARALA